METGPGHQLRALEAAQGDLLLLLPMTSSKQG
jgi:hypothetical protein